MKNNEKGQNFETLETVRNVRLRKNPKTGKIEVLLLKRENGLYEFPGGKVFDSEKEIEEFKKLSPKERYKKIVQEGVRETLEEIGQDIKEEDLHFLGKHIHELNNVPYKINKKDGVGFDKRAISYLVSWQKDPNQKIDLSNSDDGHVDYEWMPLEDLEAIMIDEEARESFFRGENKEFNRNSDITKLASSVITRVRGIVRRIEGQGSQEFIDEIYKNDYIESDIYKYKVKEDGKWVERGEQINMFDFNRFDLLTGPQRKKLFEKYWGKLEPSYKCKGDSPEAKKARENNEKILKSFNWTLDKAFGYIENHVGRTFPSELSRKMPLKNTKDIISFLNGFGRKEWSQPLTQLFKVARTYLHFKERAPYAFEGEIGLEKHAKGFGKFFRGIFNQKGKKFSLKSVGNGKKEIKLESITAANEKAGYRVVDKLITKPDLEFDNVKDIFRGRVVCDKEDFEEVARTLKSKCKTKGIELKNKGKTMNKNRGMVGVRYLVGEYPITEIIAGKEQKFMVPFEIQIIDPEELKSSEAGAKHHNVYAHKNNLGPRNTKLINGTDKSEIEKSIEKHAKDPFVQSINNRKMSLKKVGRKAIAGHYKSPRVIKNTEGNIRKEYNRVGFYTLDEKFIAYQEVLKNWGKPTGNQEWEKRMVAVLNNRATLALKKEEWDLFFRNPTKFLKETIYDLEEKNRKNTEIVERVNRFKNVVSTLPGLPKFKTDKTAAELLEYLDNKKS